MMKLLGFLLATASLAALLCFWLAFGPPHGDSELGACVFDNFVFGVALPALGVALWKSDAY